MKLDGPKNHIHDRIIRDGKKAYWAKELHRRIQNPPICRGTSGQGGSAENEECEEEEASSGVLERDSHPMSLLWPGILVLPSPFYSLAGTGTSELNSSSSSEHRVATLFLFPSPGADQDPISTSTTLSPDSTARSQSSTDTRNEAPLVHEKSLASSLARMNRQLTRDQSPATSRFEKIQRNM
ncbi:ribosomal RNA small subunit methyltransferase H, partial [Striga asiatica]